MIINNELLSLDDRLNKVFNGLVDMALVEEQPMKLPDLSITEYTETAYLQQEDAFIFVKNKINRMVDTLLQYRMVDEMGLKPFGVAYFGTDYSGINQLLTAYQAKLSEFDKAIKQIETIASLNGLI